MTKYDYLQKYISLMTQFIESNITASDFEAKYLYIFKNESVKLSDEIYFILNDLFIDVDAFCDDIDLRDEEDLDEEALRDSVQLNLKKLKAKIQD
mgnify:CR=1 FL=1|tara:strand:+ start:545 stop:829 length:285 start_codon:yes stop_codon:yes gene_type:complete